MVGIGKRRVRLNHFLDKEIEMGKRSIRGIITKKGAPKLKKTMSHSTYTAKRHPNSKRVRNGQD